jgi:hypothetical protein
LATFQEQGRQAFGEDTTQKMPRRPNTSCKDLESRYLTYNAYTIKQAPTKACKISPQASVNQALANEHQASIQNTSIEQMLA